MPELEHDWEPVELQRTGSSRFEFDVPRTDGSGAEVVEHRVFDISMTFAYAMKVASGISGADDLYDPVRARRRCRGCGQESENGLEPADSCAVRQVRLIIEG